MKNKEPLKVAGEKKSLSLSAPPLPKKSVAARYVVVAMGISAFDNYPRLKKGDAVPSSYPEKVITKLLKRGAIEAGG